MIGYIRGKVTGIYKDFCFLETGGVGYRIFISDKTRQSLQRGDEAKLLTYMSVREDAILLYGFLTEEEYDLFLILISISKIGPKVAMGILSAMEPGRFVQAVRKQDVKALTRLPGIGKKTAERLIVELKDKVGTLSGVMPADEEETEGAEGTPLQKEASQYLEALGYNMDEIGPVLKRLGSSYGNVSKLVAAALREFGKNS